MKRFLTAGFALAVLLASNLALADRDDHRNNGRDPHGKFDNRFNDSRGWDRNRGYSGFQPSYRDNRWDRRRDHDDDDVNWSVNLNIGARPFGYNPYGYNMLGYRPEPYYRPRQPVVIYQNTYIEPSHSTTIVTRRTNRQGVSLLRDSNGNCFERIRDRFGNETRTELPRSSCNF